MEVSTGPSVGRPLVLWCGRSSGSLERKDNLLQKSSKVFQEGKRAMIHTDGKVTIAHNQRRVDEAKRLLAWSHKGIPAGKTHEQFEKEPVACDCLRCKTLDSVKPLEQ